MPRTPSALFRTLAFAEAVSWTILIAAMILRSVGVDRFVVTIGGALHGFVFLAYAATAVLISRHQRWGMLPSVIAVAVAIIPYATIPTEIWLQRSGRLAGAWRVEASDDPRDRLWDDRLLRFFVRRGWLLFGLMAVLVIGLYLYLMLG